MGEISAKGPGSVCQTSAIPLLFGLLLRLVAVSENTCQKQKTRTVDGAGFVWVLSLEVKACYLAERAGFEPAVGISPHTLSRRAT